MTEIPLGTYLVLFLLPLVILGWAFYYYIKK